MKKILFAILALFPCCEMFAQQPIQQNIVVVFDDSTSMTERFGNVSRMESAKSALAFVVQRLPKNTNIGIVTLNGKQNVAGNVRWNDENWFSPFAPLDTKVVIDNLNQIKPVGNTPLGACMKVGTDVLLAKRAKQKYGVYRLLVITDGEASDPGLVEKYLPDIMSRNIYVDVIGVGMRGDHALANRVSSYKKANDPKQLAVALQASLAEVSYKDTKAADADFKMLEALPTDVTVKVIEALSDFENHPIGEKAPPKPVVTTSSTPANEMPLAVKILGGLFITFLACFCVVCVIAVANS